MRYLMTGPASARYRAVIAALAPTRLTLACMTVASMLAAPEAVAQDNNKAVAIVAVEARLMTFRDRVEALGTLRANDSVTITAVVADKISSINFQDGDRVEKSQILAEMVTTEERALLEEARSTMEEAQSQFERTKSLSTRRLTPETVLDQKRRDFETAKARLAATEARLSDRILRAPFAGRMGLRTVSVGALVAPGDVIARLEDDSVMKLDFSVPSTFISTLRPGLEIQATARGYDGETFRGKVASIDNRVDEITRTIRVRAVLPNPDRRLVPGVLMNIDLFKNPREAVAVKEEALVPIGTDTYVFVVDQEKKIAERRRVQPGSRRPGLIEITTGLQPGELVVTDGTIKLRPGASIELQRTETIEAEPIETPAAQSRQKAPDKPAGRS